MTAKLLSLFLLSMATASANIEVNSDDPQHQLFTQPAIKTVMCVYCTDHLQEFDNDGVGCQEYRTPLNTCYNAQTLFPNDDSWGDLDIYDEMLGENLKRSFYQSKDGSCRGKGEVEASDIPLNECVGPFGPPRPYGKFSLVGGDNMNIVQEK